MKKPKPRNMAVAAMISHCKGGPHKDKVKDGRRMACRVKIDAREFE